MKYRLVNVAQTYSNESLSAMLRSVLHTHCPYRKLSDWHIIVEARASLRPVPYVMLVDPPHVTLVDPMMRLYLPGPERLDMAQVVGCLRWATMFWAGVDAQHWPAGDPPWWPAPKWLDKVPPLTLYVPPTADELHALKVRARDQKIEAQRVRVKQLATKAKRATTAMRKAERSLKAMERERDKADRTFLKQGGLKAFDLHELESAITGALAEIDD